MSKQIKNSKGIPLPEQSLSNLEFNQANPVPNINGHPHQQIILNQRANPQIVYIDTTNFKTSPCNTVCPYCKNRIQTKVNTKCNWYSCLFCYFCGVLTWILIQCCRNKQLNCCDSEHFCPMCGNKIADYISC